LGTLTGYHESECDIIDSTPVEHALPSCHAIFSAGAFRGSVVQSTLEAAVPVYGCEYLRVPDESSVTAAIPKDDCVRAHDNQTTLDPLDGFAPSRIKLTKHSAKVDAVRNLIFVKDGLVCDFDRYECADGGGQYFWLPRPQRCSGFRPIVSGNFDLVFNQWHKTQSYAVSSNEDRMIVFKLTEETILCSVAAFKTDTPGVYLIPGAAYDREADDLDEWTTAAGIYSEPIGPHSRPTDAVKRRCEIKRDFFHERLYSMINNPTHDRYLVFGRGFLGTIEGFKFHLKKCRKIELSSRPVQGKCFRDIPVRDGAGREFYIKRDSRMIVTRSRAVPCNDAEETLAFVEQLWSLMITIGFVHNVFWMLLVTSRVARLLVQKMLRKFDLPVPRFVSIEIQRPANQGPLGALLPPIMDPPFFRM